MQSNAKRRFVDAYLNEVGDMRNTVNRLQLYEIIISAGKDLLMSDLGDTDCYQFDKAYEVFEQLPVTNFLELVKQNSSRINETDQNEQFVELKEFFESLNEDEELNVNEIKAALDFLKSSARYGKIDCKMLFNEFEKSRSKLLDVIAQEFTNKQIAISKNFIGSENLQRKLPERTRNSFQYLNGSIPMFTSQVTRRAFRVMNNDDRILNYHFILNHSQIICIMCELLTSNDQPTDQNYKNDIYVILYDTIEEQVITVTMNIMEDKYVSEKCLLKAGEYIVSVQTAHCSEFVITSADDEMKLVDSDGKLTKHFKMTLMNIFDLFDFDENGKLSREEFDIYNKLASDEHVLDHEWEILCQNFGAKDGELLLHSFVALHQIEANNNPSLEDTWMTLHFVGYNEQLDLINNCPCSFTIFSESIVYMKHVELREPMMNESEALADYFWRNGREVCDDIDVRIWKCDYFAVGIAGPMKLPYAMNLRYGNSKNVLVKELIELRQIPLKFVKPKILLHAIATESDWSLILKVETMERRSSD
ncbi:unnamed protein product [Cercopithifilaria johnstoni]|uniref:EF-hand domain-containing protein n=1 Tax=Cercopithifilaria johnstoni TaxID=2874296 RepID=A0A8J2M967_9BILA|nr:unnamed protein product [Cercopithifilaria johnstoni]